MPLSHCDTWIVDRQWTYSVQRVPDCLGGLSRVGISSRSTRPWNGQPPSSILSLLKHAKHRNNNVAIVRSSSPKLLLYKRPLRVATKASVMYATFEGPIDNMKNDSLPRAWHFTIMQSLMAVGPCVTGSTLGAPINCGSLASFHVVQQFKGLLNVNSRSWVCVLSRQHLLFRPNLPCDSENDISSALPLRIVMSYTVPGRCHLHLA